jgi:hypothetical protein
MVVLGAVVGYLIVLIFTVGFGAQFTNFWYHFFQH